MTTMPANPTPAEEVVVPLEPMPEMLAAFWRQKNTGSQVPGETGDDRSDYAAYRAMLAARPVATTQSAAQTGEVLKARVDTLVNILAPDQGESLSEERRRLFAIASAIQSDLRALSQPEAGR